MSNSKHDFMQVSLSVWGVGLWQNKKKTMTTAVLLQLIPYCGAKKLFENPSQKY